MSSFDGWTIAHFIVGFILAVLLVPIGVPIAALIIISIIWEYAEAWSIGRVVFGWKSTAQRESRMNSGIDILTTVVGIYLGGAVAAGLP